LISTFILLISTCSGLIWNQLKTQMNVDIKELKTQMNVDIKELKNQRNEDMKELRGLLSPLLVEVKVNKELYENMSFRLFGSCGHASG
jgi:sensor domain CHASE-containing protein